MTAEGSRLMGRRGWEAGSVDHTSKEFCCQWVQREAKGESGVEEIVYMLCIYANEKD